MNIDLNWFFARGQYILGIFLSSAAIIIAVGFTIVDLNDCKCFTCPCPTPLPKYDYPVYCPIDSELALNKLNQAIINKGMGGAINFGYNLDSQTYVVYAFAKADQQNNGGLYYCGLARKWKENDCSKAEIVCSRPGPMFYFPVKQEATIIWVNELQDAASMNWNNEGTCYADNPDVNACTVRKKMNNAGACTFNDPTNYFYNKFDTIRVRQTSMPMSPHIHGLQVRPIYDGNPLSWFNTNGDKGPGYNTLFNELYFQLFFNQDVYKGVKGLTPDMSRRMKIIRVTNDQSPGMLFYHDNGMKSTKFNVQNGLAGLYVIYDPIAEQKLPKNEHQNFILFSKGSVFISNKNPAVNDQKIEYNSFTTYRLRFLNSHVDNPYKKIRLAAYYDIQNDHGTIKYRQTDYQLQSTPNIGNQHKLPFSIIGADTSLMAQPLHNQNTFDLGPAQRVDTLIRFGTSLPQGIKKVYLVAFDFNLQKQIILNIFYINNNQIVNKYLNPNDYTSIAVPFTDLSLVPDGMIATQRHRPLFSLPFDTRFMIGAHYMFEMGASENPKIGTIQDFYIVNNLFEGHPIHFHLINFQIMKSYSLKRIPKPTTAGIKNADKMECTYYMLDYFKGSGRPQFQGKTYPQLCDYIWQLNDSEVLTLFESFNNYQLQNQVSGKISGMNVMELSGGDPNYHSTQDNCPMDGTHKYVCADVSSQTILPHQRRWKDTAFVDEYTVFVIRIRWASNSYSDPTMQAYPYFRIPQAHLVQFPGYVYHCHILMHQDNQMMRPFVLLFSDYYIKHFNLAGVANYCDRTNWLDMMTCFNTMNFCPI